MKTGETAIVIATESHRAAVLAIRRGVLIPLEVTEKLSTFMPNETVDPVRFFDIACSLIEEAAKVAQREHALRLGGV
jgi:hypothetical protein